MTEKSSKRVTSKERKKRQAKKKPEPGIKKTPKKRVAKAKLTTPLLDKALSRRLSTATAFAEELKDLELPVEETGIPDKTLAKHPLYAAALWLIKWMYASEVAYYRKLARQKNVPLVNAVISDMLGFFNVQNADICENIKRNKSIINTSNGLRNKD